MMIGFADARAWRACADVLDLVPLKTNGHVVAARYLRAAAEEVDRLRAAIANAPHDSRCTIHPEPGYTPNCTCWKAKL